MERLEIEKVQWMTNGWNNDSNYGNLFSNSPIKKKFKRLDKDTFYQSDNSLMPDSENDCSDSESQSITYQDTKKFQKENIKLEKMYFLTKIILCLRKMNFAVN